MPTGKVFRYNARPVLHRPLYLRQELPESRPGRSCPCATLDSSLRGAVREIFGVKRSFEQVNTAKRVQRSTFRRQWTGKCPAGMPNRLLFGLSAKPLRFLDKPG